ncbi:MAG: bacteriohopanetetrol glucosamine biosynthesis glycosyltransferase HpnI [Nostoc sp.]|uniref:bacteriohopanetetrol glucosamine biosynthesis glycosyltransferase HpnI n=1 Tax=Nostoc sp. TaxID=1180 RepID=UPI002FFC0CA4
MTIINVLLLVLCLSTVLFYCYGIYAAITFANHLDLIDPEFHPPVTILKPICGLDKYAYENFASFCQQNYPEYQMIFGVCDPEDPAIKVVKKIIQQFPDIDIHLVVSDRIIGTNLKVSNLANAVAAAKHEILVIADSDTRVGTDYLQRVIQPLKDHKVGVVTCMYRSLAQGWVATLEAIATATHFHAGVLVSNQLEGTKFACGSTIVIGKQVLKAIGGFEAIADYLADDFQLGYLPGKIGYKVVLSNYVVDHVLGSTTLADAIRRQIRWTRCIRVSRPWGYLGLLFTHGTVASLLFLMATKGSIAGWIGLVITWMMRLLMGWIVGVNILNDLNTKKFFWVIPLRDLIQFAIWCYGFLGNTITWRGQRLKLTKGGKLVSITTPMPNA